MIFLRAFRRHDDAKQASRRMASLSSHGLQNVIFRSLWHWMTNFLNIEIKLILNYLTEFNKEKKETKVVDNCMKNNPYKF